MTREDFKRFADLLPQAVLMVGATGEIHAANQAAQAQFADATHLADLLDAPVPDVSAFLRMASRVRRPVVAAFGLREGRGRHRLEGGLLVPGTGAQCALLSVRFVPEIESTSAFKVLNSRLSALRAELAARQRVHAEVSRNREWLRVTLMSIGDAVMATDASGRIELMNPVAEALTGWTQAEVAGQPLDAVFRIVSEETRARVENPVERVLREGTTVGLANHTLLISRNGTEWPIDDSAAPIRDDKGALIGVVLVFHEVSERRRLEQVASAQLRQLSELNQRKDEFLAMLAHELRNPLSPILTAASSLTDAAGESQAVRVGRIIERQARHMARMVDDLLDVARLTRGMVTLKMNIVDVAAIAGHVAEAVGDLVQARGQVLVVELPSTALQVHGDATRLEQAIGNLLHNAIKFTPEGGRIVLAVRAEAGEVCVVVRDDGPGIDPELLPQVFELFVQGDKSLHRTQGGLGIGLTVVNRLVAMHGGTVRAFSAGANQGSRFEIRLPAAAARVPQTSDGPNARPANGRGLDVLLVDDNADAAEVLGMYLEGLGHKVRVAHDGTAALDMAATGTPPDAVLLDIGLPGMDGFEVARRLRAQPRTRLCTLIALTGYGDEEHRRRAMEAGFSHHVVKPADPVALGRLLAQLHE